MVAFSICATVIQKNYRTVEEVLVCRYSIIDQVKIVFNEHIKNKGSFFNYDNQIWPINDHLSKGQKISKANYGVLNSPKKTNAGIIL